MRRARKDKRFLRPSDVAEIRGYARAPSGALNRRPRSTVPAVAWIYRTPAREGGPRVALASAALWGDHARRRSPRLGAVVIPGYVIRPPAGMLPSPAPRRAAVLRAAREAPRPTICASRLVCAEVPLLMRRVF